MSFNLNKTFPFYFLATIELYEGNTQANSTVWTSFDAPPLPAIEQQAYIIPATIVSMRETITEKGITNKHVLSMSSLKSQENVWFFQWFKLVLWKKIVYELML